MVIVYSFYNYSLLRFLSKFVVNLTHLSESKFVEYSFFPASFTYYYKFSFYFLGNPSVIEHITSLFLLPRNMSSWFSRLFCKLISLLSITSHFSLLSIHTFQFSLFFFPSLFFCSLFLSSLSNSLYSISWSAYLYSFISTLSTFSTISFCTNHLLYSFKILLQIFIRLSLYLPLFSITLLSLSRCCFPLSPSLTPSVNRFPKRFFSSSEAILIH